MVIEDLVLWLVIGGVAGWLAGLIVTGYSLGLIGKIIHCETRGGPDDLGARLAFRTRQASNAMR
jgi:hypothetical protein